LNIFHCGSLRSQLGLGAVLLLIGVVWMSEWRQQLRIPYWFWKFWHGIMATVMVPMALAHIFIGGTYTNTPIKQAVWIGYSVLLTGTS
jgi:predicted ferric reductase